VESIVVSLFSPGLQRNAIVAIHHPAETAGGGCGVRMPQALENVTDCAWVAGCYHSRLVTA